MVCLTLKIWEYINFKKNMVCHSDPERSEGEESMLTWMIRDGNILNILTRGKHYGSFADAQDGNSSLVVFKEKIRTPPFKSRRAGCAIPDSL